MSAGSATFCYDANGNMTQKIDGSTTSYTYDAENRMTAVSGAATATFVYDEDGNRVKGTVDGVTTTYIGNHFEWTGSTSTMKKYYYAGGTRVAERVGTLSTSYYFLPTDHLGSTSITATRLGVFSSELRYKAWGETRYSSGSTPTIFRYTGQREDSYINLYFMGSRWYDPALGRFISPDIIVPDPHNPQAFDRYSYVYNNPIRYTDPSGHCVEGNDDFDECMDWVKRIEKKWKNVNVITCTGGDAVDGCKGWIAEEMILLYQTLREYSLGDLLDNGNVTMIRSSPRNDNEGRYAGLHTTISNNQSEIRIYDLAWEASPALGIQDAFDLGRNSSNFKGTIAHELTHAVQNFNPEVYEAFVQAKEESMKTPGGWLAFNLTVGVNYNWSVYDQYKNDPALYNRLVQSEYMALMVAGLSYDSWFGMSK